MRFSLRRYELWGHGDIARNHHPCWFLVILPSPPSFAGNPISCRCVFWRNTCALSLWRTIPRAIPPSLPSSDSTLHLPAFPTVADMHPCHSWSYSTRLLRSAASERPRGSGATVLTPTISTSLLSTNLPAVLSSSGSIQNATSAAVP